MFRQRTQLFDMGMLMETCVVDRGLVMQLDAELAEASKQLLVQATSRLPRKGSDLVALAEERDRNYKRTAWNNEYFSLLNMSMKLSDLYGPENQGLAPGNLILLEQRITPPAMSESLDEIRISIKKFQDTLRVE